jgi:methenyltetrahydrofolate cyclohydrolase
MMRSLPLEGFLEDLASAQPTPGGGGAAALIGASGAALVSMVCRLTIGKKGYEDATEKLNALLESAEASRIALIAMIDEDKAAFDTLMAGYRLPKSNDQEKAIRSEAIQHGLKVATEAPLQCARACAHVVHQAAQAADQGHPQIISDAGVGVLAAIAGLRSAALNVRVNTPQIKDRAFADAAQAEVAALLADCIPLAERVHDTVVQRLG